MVPKSYFKNFNWFCVYKFIFRFAEINLCDFHFGKHICAPRRCSRKNCPKFPVRGKSQILKLQENEFSIITEHVTNQSYKIGRKAWGMSIVEDS